ncbi:unnamed protein product [Pleuronectes platessa]|uniref:Uncharacterized protein n=1 Tax=Pleuronectes platessa TaxID=8262 RepID=A0A9N7U9Q1_PLEPL|nr:unnamed protein product [Pleuronectes platessa]
MRFFCAACGRRYESVMSLHCRKRVTPTDVMRVLSFRTCCPAVVTGAHAARAHRGRICGGETAHPPGLRDPPADDRLQAGEQELVPHQQVSHSCPDRWDT